MYYTVCMYVCVCVCICTWRKSIIIMSQLKSIFIIQIILGFLKRAVARHHAVDRWKCQKNASTACGLCWIAVVLKYNDFSPHYYTYIFINLRLCSPNFLFLSMFPWYLERGIVFKYRVFSELHEQRPAGEVQQITFSCSIRRPLIGLFSSLPDKN